MTEVGFVGLGIMGKPMAKQLLKKNIKIYVNDLDEINVGELEKLGATRATLCEIGKRCNIIFTILPNGEVVKSVLFGKDGICEEIKEDSIVCDMSSVTPIESRECFEWLAMKKVRFLDAPVSGGEPKAIDGTLAFMVGGNEEDFYSLKPYFEIMGSSALLIGGPGSGSIAKLANQIIVNNTIAIVSEAFVFVSKAGADPEKVYNAIRNGLAGSAVLEAKIPMILTRNFKPGGKIAVNHKDIKNVISTAHANDVPIPYTAQLFEILQTLKVAGYMEEDHSAIIKYFERLADILVEKKRL